MATGSDEQMSAPAFLMMLIYGVLVLGSLQFIFEKTYERVEE